MLKTIFAALFLLPVSSVSAGDKKLVVHEWGTFTSLQDESGTTMSRINGEDEPLPAFCHDLIKEGRYALLSKGAPVFHRSVTMRLETPVVYFYPPTDAKLPMTIDVSVEFRGGWLTQFYPIAASVPDKRKPQQPDSEADLTPDVIGSLEWKSIHIGAAHPKLIPALEKVWNAPRAVSATPVTADNGEAEKFLFYRGVANINAPLRASRIGDQLVISSQLKGDVAPAMTIKSLWVTDFRSDGRCAFRELPALTLKPDSPLPLLRTDAAFDEASYSAPVRLRESMRKALIADGLFEDEVEAMLKTWELSYFNSPGCRIFYLVPRAWTDHYLPIRFSTDCDITRTMMGRLELITPQQRVALATLRDPKVADSKRESIYQSMGRFKKTLVVDEFIRTNDPQLRDFIQSHRIWQNDMW